jgi:hypothetical protein
MLTVVQRGGATRQKPPVVVRGQACRLPWAWDGLVFGVPFNDSTRDSARDLVAQAAPSDVSGLTWEKDDRGNVAAYMSGGAGGSGGHVSYPDNPAHNRPSTAITVYVRVRRKTTADAGGGFLTKRYAATDPFLSWGLMTDGTNATALGAHITVNSTAHFWDSTYVLATTLWASGVLRWRTGEAPRLDVFGDRGELLASLAHNQVVSGTITYATGMPITFNATENDLVNSDAVYTQGMVWSRKLSDVELQALFADPYGWYSPRRETIGLSSPYPLIAPQSFMREVPSG